MKQESPTTMKSETNSTTVSIPITPSRTRVSPKPKTTIKPETPNGANTQKTIRRSLVINKPKSGEDVPIVVVGSQKGSRIEEPKVVRRSVNRPVVEHLSPATRRLSDPANSRKKIEGELNVRHRELQEKIDRDESLINSLQSEVLELKAELDKSQKLNIELESTNKKLVEDLATAEAKITALTTPQRESVSEYQSPKFRDIQKLIANKLEQSTIKKEAVINEPNIKRSPSATTPAPCSVISSTADLERKVVAQCTLGSPPPPPPLPPSRPLARAAVARKTTPKPVIQLYHSFARNKDLSGGGNHNKIGVNSAHNSIVGEIQNRSAHLLAIRMDIETKGGFIEGLIQKVMDVAYTDIEDVVNFVNWLDNQLSTLADERAVLKQFKWPEKKADALREAAIEYRNLKLLESEVSSYKDDSDVQRGVALKKMASLLDKSEQSIQRLIKLRNSVMRTYRDHKIPTDWMLDNSAIITKIKKSSAMLAKLYVKRITGELEANQYSDRDSTQESLLVQSVHFAYKAQQFCGGLDSETLCAFEEIRKRVPAHLQGSQELFIGS